MLLYALKMKECYWALLQISFWDVCSGVCKLREIIDLLYIAIVKHQLGNCVDDFTFKDAYESLVKNFKENKNHPEKKTSEEKLKRLNAFV